MVAEGGGWLAGAAEGAALGHGDRPRAPGPLLLLGPAAPFPRCLLANLLLDRLCSGMGMVVAAAAAEPWGRLGSASRYRGRFELASLPPPPWRVGLTVGESLAPVSPPPDAKAVFPRVNDL